MQIKGYPPMPHTDTPKGVLYYPMVGSQANQAYNLPILPPTSIQVNNCMMLIQPSIPPVLTSQQTSEEHRHKGSVLLIRTWDSVVS